MVFYLNRLECLIERWQSRKKTVEISQISAKSNKRQQKRENRKPVAVQNRPTTATTTTPAKIKTDKGDNDNSNHRNSNNKIEQHYEKPSSSTNQLQSMNNQGKDRIAPTTELASGGHPIPKVVHTNDDYNNNGPMIAASGDEQDQRLGAATCGGGGGGIQKHSMVRRPEADGALEGDSKTACEPQQTSDTTTMMLIKHHPHHPLPHQQQQTLNTTNLIPVLSVLVLLVGLFSQTMASGDGSGSSSSSSSSSSSNGGASSLTAPPAIYPPSPTMIASPLASSMAAARQIGQQLNLSNMLQQFAGSPGTRSRWTQIPGPQTSNRDPPGTRHQTYLGRAVSRLRNRIGARNTIRVHNAFRDFAWRLLSSMNMPTPVIYELRRQHLYSPEDDLMNDSLYNRNTSKTVRSKRQLLKYLPDDNRSERRWNQGDRAGLSVFRPRARDDDDDEKESLSERIRGRFEELASISSRSLFGRVIRLPSLFPFKRQEDSDDTKLPRKVGTGGRRARRRRRKKEEDRQIISINGKQYYVNDEGELKELNEKSEE